MCSTETDESEPVFFRVIGPPVAYIEKEVSWEYDIDDLTDSEVESE